MFKLFKVELEIEDLNDNAPQFPEHTIEVNMSEEATIGHMVRLGKIIAVLSVYTRTIKY